MNKGELIAAVSAETNQSKRDVSHILTATLEIIEKVVAEGEKVTLVGFGSFVPRDRSAREGRNPQTGEAMSIPATIVPGFSAGKAFKEKVSALAK